MFERLTDSLAGSSPTVFFRDDDADTDLPELRTLLDTFHSRGVPLSLAVIPGTLQESGVQLLCAAAARQPLELHQHGWIHRNHELEGRKSEFGPSRSYAQQFDDIARGSARLKDAFGERFAPIFTPPWNRCTSDTRKALVSLNFRALSTTLSDRGIGSHAALAEMPVSVDIFHWRDAFRLKTEDEITSEFINLSKKYPLGVLLHHKVMSKEAWQLLEQLLDALAKGRTRFQVMENQCPVAS